MVDGQKLSDIAEDFDINYDNVWNLAALLNQNWTGKRDCGINNIVGCDL